MSHGLQRGLIDVHAHVAPGCFPPSPDPGEGRWPCMVCGADQRRTVMIDGKPFRVLDDRSWSAARRVEDMDRGGVAVQVLSPMPELLSYWFDTPTAGALGDHTNGVIAQMVADRPDRFLGLGTIPMQAPDEAVRALVRIKTTFGLRGVEIGSNINGTPIGDARFEPVYAAAADLGLAVFVHALHPLATKGLTQPPAVTPIAGFPLDTGLAAASVLMSGLMSRLPGLRIGFSHGGGALGAMLGRLDQGWRLTNGFGGAAGETPSRVARKMFYDSNVYDPGYLAYLATRIAPGQVFMGTDYPYDVMQLDLPAYLQQALLDAEALQSLTSGAALRFLGLADSSAL